MKPSQPPRIATWLLKRLASGPERESLIGDLIEQYQRGRSSVWYWRQVLIAIVAGATRDVRDHKVLALRALAIGWGALLFLSLVSATLPVSGTISVLAVGPQTVLGLLVPRAWGTWWVHHVILLYGWSR